MSWNFYRKRCSGTYHLVPDARVAIAHGQMSELKLEELMLDFLEGNFDVLVCTTIIETGMDISNVNTIIINEADKLGLSQLYQLRGRVGRTNRIAYAYLLYKPEKILSEIAEKRLKAIKEFTNLGSGFKIAMRDLEIRGAGNILGPEQHGHIEAIGFSLYCKLLEEAVNNLKNEGIEEDVEVSLELKVDAYIPDEYISDSRQKIEVYKKIDAISDMEEYSRLKKELQDRFGDLKKEVIILLELAKIKIKGREMSLVQIKEKGQALELQFSKNHSLSGEKLVAISQEFDGLKFVASNEPKIKMSNSNLSDQDKVNLIIDILNFLSPQ
ncbi:helicase-like protein [Orenia metallireducens]|uniref:TRCF domain-containing protein n=1 Tax=Orenia metallireducens TaxID=1413210 RepID=UPI000D0761C3|nr:TRCF domain-containing protein [Orenia metallireducens]PRX21781.1 helicase-like protein [Orenia metallireducens]